MEEEAAFVLLERSLRGDARGFTLLPRAHVKVLTDLPAPQMAAVLAGLKRASTRLRREVGPCEVEVQVFPHGLHPRAGHLRFYLIPQAEAVHSGASFSESAFASLDDAVNH